MRAGTASSVACTSHSRFCGVDAERRVVVRHAEGVGDDERRVPRRAAVPQPGAGDPHVVRLVLVAALEIVGVVWRTVLVPDGQQRSVRRLDDAGGVDVAAIAGEDEALAVRAVRLEVGRADRRSGRQQMSTRHEGTARDWSRNRHVALAWQAQPVPWSVQRAVQRLGQLAAASGAFHEPGAHQPFRQPRAERGDLTPPGRRDRQRQRPVSMPRAASPIRTPQGVGNGAICEISSSSSPCRRAVSSGCPSTKLR